VQPGAVFAGLRVYFKYLPFFLLPAVYEFSDDEIKKQLKLVLGLALLQFPLVLYQRFIKYAGVSTGDYVTGTLNISSILSIFLISTISVVYSFYLKELISKKTLFALLLLLFIPTTLNETKGSFFLLPFAFLLPKAGSSENTFMDLFTEGRIISYLYKGIDIDYTQGERSVEDEVGRVDSYVLAINKLSDDYTKLFMGLGIGNVGPSFYRPFTGEYSTRYARYGPNITTVAYLLWEIGIIGLLLVLVTCYLFFKDAQYLSRENNVVGAIALGWTGVVAISVLSMGYKSLLPFNVIGYLFFYFSGYIVSTKLRLENCR
jgi:hypothetical protein